MPRPAGSVCAWHGVDRAPAARILRAMGYDERTPRAGRTELAALRSAYARRLVGEDGPAALRDAFARVEREHFLGPGPWQLLGGTDDERSVTDDPALLYQDALVALSRERGINNGQPSLHARCIAACAPQPGEQVVHIGAGTGYYTAILAELVGRAGAVLAFEIEADLADAARRLLARDWPQVRVVCASATEVTLPAADVIYACAGATHPPAAWLDALRPGGRLVLPLTPDLGPGPMLLITRRGAASYAARALMMVAFIPCNGARDAASSDALQQALATRSPHEIRSLRRDTPPDETLWCAGADAWLSTADPGPP